MHVEVVFSHLPVFTGNLKPVVSVVLEHKLKRKLVFQASTKKKNSSCFISKHKKKKRYVKALLLAWERIKDEFGFQEDQTTAEVTLMKGKPTVSSGMWKHTKADYVQSSLPYIFTHH